MKSLFRQLGMVMVMMAGISSAYAVEAFSFAVLQLHHELKSESPWSRVINTQKEWQTFYDQLTEGLVFIVPELPPQIDFEQYQVITGGLGKRPTGGYAVVVDRVDELSDALYVSVLEVTPSKDCVLTQAITHPSTAIMIKKTTKPIKFSLAKLTRECAA